LGVSGGLISNLGEVRPLQTEDLSAAEAFLDEHMGGRMQARRGELIDVLALPGFVAEREGELVGVLTYDQQPHETELTVIAAHPRHSGIGSTLLDALVREVRGRIWLITTNDNVDALRFYQRKGFRLRALHVGAMDAARALKPQIPVLGSYGIPMRDELELELVVG
jgi:ribosomal protein S18 acetylase RimI-like enzyme